MQNKPNTDAKNILIGKVPPNALEAEKSVLGTILVDFRAYDTAIEILKPDFFYSEAHKLIFEAMMNLNKKGNRIDLISICNELVKLDTIELVGGAVYISKITNVVYSASVEQHSRIILEKFMQREVIRLGMEMINSGYDETKDVFDLIDESEKGIFEVSNSLLSKDFQSLLELGIKVINRIDQLRNSGEELSGIPSGFRDIDRVIHGWQNTDLVILAARPSVGKSAFALNLAVNACQKSAVGLFSLEMSAEQLTQRVLSAESEVWMDKISQGKVTDYDYEIIMSKGIKKIESLPIFIDDTAALSIFQLKAKARRMVSRNNVGLIIIDYLQLIVGPKEKNGTREQEISAISRNLKALAKDLKVPVIALSQLSRSVETRGAKTPMLSDLRESGAIEQDADIVAFLSRVEDTNMVNFKIAKHRNGSLSEINLIADLTIQKFHDFEEDKLVTFLPKQSNKLENIF